MKEYKEITLEMFQNEMKLFREEKRTDKILEYHAKEGPEDWNYAAFNIGYSIADDKGFVNFDDDTMEVPKSYGGQKLLCYSYQRNYSSDEGVFAIDVLEDWPDEEIYIELTKYGKLYQ